jgi:hypothetical protein
MMDYKAMSHVTLPHICVLSAAPIGLTDDDYRLLTSLLDLKEIGLFVKILTGVSPDSIQQYVFMNMVIILSVPHKQRISWAAENLSSSQGRLHIR